MENFKIAIIQVEAGNLQKNLLWMKKTSKDSAPDMVVFPETITTGFSTGIPPEELYNKVDFIPGKITYPYQEAAGELGIFVILPTYEKGESKDVIYNSVAIIDPRGEIVGIYRKTHPFPAEDINRGGWTTPGDEVEIFSLPFCKIGITICYEGDFPELSRILALKGAEVILRPSALLRDYDIWELTNRARAFDNHVYFIGINAVGQDPGGNYYFGHSMIIDPLGRKIAQATGKEEILVTEISQFKMTKTYNHLHDRNTAVYGFLV
ncbi:MAG: carbon-nitrogen hydrolase family protein [Candidatus Eremiobacteraeota bacterium]|nr:carbon-nitrogen hydrolase family protein [Candidatus Eremiobacteraeota bacterium]